jgi:hypothetical protein
MEPYSGSRTICGFINCHAILDEPRQDGTIDMVERDETAKAQIKLRLREPLRAKLEEEAKKRAFSLNSEVIRRLENSLLDEQIGSIVFHDKDVFALANIFTTIVRAFQIQRKKMWHEDPEICKIAADTLCTLLAKAPELFDTGSWPGGIRTVADQGALAMIQALIQMDEKVRGDDA